MATKSDFSEQIDKSTSDFLRDIDKLKAIEAMDRATIAAAFERQVKKLIDEEVRPKIQEAVKTFIEATIRHTPPPTLPPGATGGGDSGGDLPRRVERLEVKVDKMADDVSDIKAVLARMESRMDTFATSADLANTKTSIIIWVVGAIFLAQLLPAFVGWLKQFAP